MSKGNVMGKRQRVWVMNFLLQSRKCFQNCCETINLPKTCSHFIGLVQRDIVEHIKEILRNDILSILDNKLIAKDKLIDFPL